MLRYIDISYCTRVTDIGLHQLRKLRALKNLLVTGCSRVTEGGLRRLSRSVLMKSLREGDDLVHKTYW